MTLERNDITLMIGGEPRLFKLTDWSETMCDYEHGDMKAWGTVNNCYISLHFGGRKYAGVGNDWPAAVAAFEMVVNQHIDQLRSAACLPESHP